MDERLSLAHLERHDPRASRGRERRFLCPLCGTGKPADAAHRSLVVNTSTGAWKCHRCGASGKLTEYIEYTKKEDTMGQSSQAKQRWSPPPAPTVDRLSLDSWQEAKAKARATRVSGTPGQEYLASRGIPEECMGLTGYTTDWGGRECVVFLMLDENNEPVAGMGRSLSENRHQAAGNKGQGVFRPTMQGDPEVLAITEAPIDALSLYAAGLYSIALCGSSWPEWLPKRLAFRKVLLATDADEAGDKAAEALATVLAVYGCTCHRLRPPSPHKDWNEYLMAEGRDRLREIVSQALSEVTP